jgi:peptidyl-prolyl cis-trans isomerase SurA
MRLQNQNKNGALMKKIILPLLFVILTGTLFAQTPQTGLVMDKVVARVGNMMIMQSDVNGQMALWASKDPSVKLEDIEKQKQMLDMIIDEKLIIAKAIEDSMDVTEAQINQTWDIYLQNMIQEIGSEKRIEQLYGMSIPEIRQRMKIEIRNKQLSDMVKEKEFGSLKITRNDVEKFYDAYKDSIPDIPESIELFHIIKKITAKASAKEDAYQFALKIRDSILKGGDFGEYAKKYSDDVYSKPEGGNLGWFEKSKLFPEFVKGASSINTGEVSMPIETPLGYHLVQTIEKTETQLNTRHILFKIGKSENDRIETMDFLKKLKDSVDKGASFENLARKYSDDKDTKGYGGAIGINPMEAFPSTIQALLKELKDGQVSEPMPYEADSYQLLYRKRTIKPHKANLTDDYKRIEQYALVYKQNQMLKDWVQKLRKTLYWEYVK